jgi:hypothetical protein
VREESEPNGLSKQQGRKEFDGALIEDSLNTHTLRGLNRDGPAFGDRAGDPCGP